MTQVVAAIVIATDLFLYNLFNFIELFIVHDNLHLIQSYCQSQEGYFRPEMRMDQLLDTYSFG